MLVSKPVTNSVKATLCAAAMAAVSISCDYRRAEVGPMRNDPISIERGSADHANVELDIGSGELDLGGGSDQLLNGTFEYNVTDYKPVIESSVNGTHAIVTVRQHAHGHWGGNVHNAWHLKLNNDAVLDVAINCGAGQAQLSLGSTKLRALDVHMGAGQVDLDLRGKPMRDYDVTISGGIGQATVHLPKEVGIRADAHGGLGSINVQGLTKHGDHYENDAYNKGKVNIHVTVNSGVGEIDLIG